MTGEDLHRLLSELKSNGSDLSDIRFNFSYHCNHTKHADDINIISLATFSSAQKTLTITFSSRASDMDEIDEGYTERNINHFIKAINTNV
jgi:hypothetical protein